MSREIVLRGQISGTRNGKDWPGPGTRIELDDAEADGLVQGQMAFEVDDPRVGAPLADEILAGAPEARDWTAGQPDTNLDRARAVAQHDGDSVELVRAAAERAGLDDAHTVRSADPNQAIVGDDKPNPTDAPSLVALPQAVEPGHVDDGARLVDDNRVETGSVDPDAGTERAADTGKPTGRRTAAKVADPKQ